MDLNGLLLNHIESTFGQLVTQASAIDAFKQARSECAVDSHRTAQDLICYFICFHTRQRYESLVSTPSPDDGNTSVRLCAPQCSKVFTGLSKARSYLRRRASS